MAEVSGETVGIIGACVTALGVFGGSIKWIFATRATQQRMVDDAVRRQFKHIEEELAGANRKLGYLTQGFTMLMGEAFRHYPDSPVLKQARSLFEQAFELPIGTPDNIADLMDKLRGQPR